MQSFAISKAELTLNPLFFISANNPFASSRFPSLPIDEGQNHAQPEKEEPVRE